MITLANNLRYLRKERKLSQQEIADTIGIKQRTYSDYEMGKSLPTADVLVKLADFFGKSLDILVRVSLPLTEIGKE